MKALVVFAVLAGSILFIACVQGFAPAERLTTVRVLAIRANPVELEPDGSVTLEALVYVPRDAGASPVTQAWSWCPQLGSASDNYACAISAEALSSALFPDAGAVFTYDGGSESTMSFSWPVAPELLETLCFAGAGNTASDGGSDAGEDAGTDAGTDAGSSTIRLACPNSSLTLAVLLSVGVGDTHVSATRSLAASFKLPRAPSTNPSISSISAALEGVAVASGGQLIAGQSYTLTAEVPSSASDRYSQTIFVPTVTDGGEDGGDDAGFMLPPGARVTVTAVEGLTIAWYVEEGSLSSATTLLAAGQLDDAGSDVRDSGPLVTNTWTIPAGTRGTVKVIAVIRDTRAGVDWLESSFDVQGGAP